MKKIFILFILICFIIPAYAEIKMTINEFSGGKLDFFVKFNTDALYGARGDGLKTGGTVSTLDFMPSFTSNNPACLAYIKSPVFSMMLNPIEISDSIAEVFIGKTFDSEMTRAINDGIKDAIENNEDFDTSPGVETKMEEVKASLAQVNTVLGFEGILPVAQSQAGIALSREERFSTEINLLLNGLGTLINITDTDDPGFNMALRANIDGATNFKIKNVVTSVGIGRQLNKFWGIGAALEYIDSRFILNGQADINAIGTLSSTTLEYNTNENNSLKQEIAGELYCQRWALRFGTTLHAPNDIAEFALDFSIQPELKYSGNINGVYRSLPKESSDIISDFMSSMTETETHNIENTSGDLKIKIPSFMRVILAWKPGPVLSFNYTRYFDAFDIKYETDYVYGNGFLDLRDAFRIGFNFEWFQFGGGVILAHEGYTTIDKKKDETKSEDTWFIIPLFSLGGGIPLGSYVRAEYVLFAFPMPILKMALTVTF